MHTEFTLISVVCESGMQVGQERPLHKYRHSHLLRNFKCSKHNQEHLENIEKLEASHFWFLVLILTPYNFQIRKYQCIPQTTFNPLVSFSTIFLQTFYIHQKKQKKVSYETMTPQNSVLFTCIYAFFTWELQPLIIIIG